MQELDGRVAVVTGAGSGIGRGMAHAFADAGMRIVVADIEQAAAMQVAAELAAEGAHVISAQTDVADASAVEALAEAAYAEFGAVDLLCNNAGVATLEAIVDTTVGDWNWMLDVNLHGVLNGLRAFLPRMRLQPGEKHVVNTASMNSWLPVAAMGAYSAAKHAVLGLSESLRDELADEDFGVSVLCPGAVATQIGMSERNRQDRYGPGSPLDPGLLSLMSRSYHGRPPPTEGMDPMDLGRTVRRGVEHNWRYIFSPGPDVDLWIALATERFDDVLAALEGAKRAADARAARRD